jgi:phosphoinositide-3-kinase regulatory subunit 4
MLKCAFFDAIIGVAVFVGGASLEGYILPLMVQALTDPEESVVERVIRAFSSIAELGLFQRSKTWELVDIVARLTMHPNVWIREAAAQFISAAAKYLEVADTHSILVNLIKPYLKIIPFDFSETHILESLKKPLPRLILDMASNWATQQQRGLFWAAAKQQQTFSFGSSDDTLPTISGRELDSRILQKVPKNDEDELWLRKLRNGGMVTEDEFKLVALREFIWRVAQRRQGNATNSSAPEFNKIVALKDLGIIPETVLFESNARQVVDQVNNSSSQEERPVRPRKLTDALKDAYTEGAPESPTSATADKQQSTPLPIRPRVSVSPTEPHSGPDSASSEADSRRASLLVPRSSNQSPIGSLGAYGDHLRPLRHRNSALSLLNKGENKASPEIGTTSTNAFGRVDGVSGRDVSRSRQNTSTSAAEQRPTSPSRIRFRDAHNYRKNNPTVLKLLDSMLVENMAPDDIEFGPRIQPTARRKPIRYKNNRQSASGMPWRPEGVLVTTFGEHTAAVTRILVAPDHTFFITGSDDGTVKVWDTSRLERYVSRRSRQTYRLGDGVRVTSLTFVEQTYCFVVTGSDGSVNVVRVNYYLGHDGAAKVGKFQVLREYSLPEGTHAVWSEHYLEDNKSVLLLATNTSKIIALDLRSMTELFTLNNPLNHGTPTCFCVDRKHHWIMVGTSHGVLDLWDLRFKLRLKGWVFHGAAPIHRLILPKLKKRNPLYIAGGTGQSEFTVWDVEKMICREVYRTGTAKDIGLKSTTLIDLDEEKAGGMLGRFSSLEPTASAPADNGIRALAVNFQAADDRGEPKYLFLLSVGPDWKVRYWDTHRPETSLVVSGMKADELKPQYNTTQPSPDTIVVTEKLSEPPSPVPAGRESRSSNSSAKRGTQKTSRSTAGISSQQQQLLKSHLDTVLDVALIEQPYGMVISADRSGVVYLFM